MKNMTALIIMDGFGERAETQGNAIRLAGTPNIDKLKAEYPHTVIGASGMDVGLPDGQMGNSEVGHLNIGAGRIVCLLYTSPRSSIPSATARTRPSATSTSWTATLASWRKPSLRRTTRTRTRIAAAAAIITTARTRTKMKTRRTRTRTTASTSSSTSARTAALPSTTTRAPSTCPKSTPAPPAARNSSPKRLTRTSEQSEKGPRRMLRRGPFFCPEM